MKSLTATTTILTLSALLAAPAFGVTITIDYRYDTNNYFSNAQAKASLEAAVARWNRVLADGNLAATSINDTNDGRIGFTHPGTGVDFQVSGAASFASDSIAGGDMMNAASEYRSINWAADEWILYAGGRSFASAGVGGTGTGLNFNSTFADPNSHLNRGFAGHVVAAGNMNLPTWGGSISFDTGTSFSFNGDFYTIALHEIGHAFGLSLDFDNVTRHVTGTNYTGANALAAFNADNGTMATSLGLASVSDLHWADNGPIDGSPNAAQSNIFEPGNPELAGTVGLGNLQDLLMEPIAHFGGGTTRFELTNVDVGALQDIGWTVTPEPSSVALLGLGSLAFILRRRK